MSIRDSQPPFAKAEDNPDWPEHKNIQAVVPEISAMMAGGSGIGHSRTHSRINEVAKDLKRVRRDVQLQSEIVRRNSETLQRLGSAQIPALRIPAVQAQIVLPPVDQMADPRGPCLPGLRVPNRPDRCGIQRCRQ